MVDKYKRLQHTLNSPEVSDQASFRYSQVTYVVTCENGCDINA